ncbi:MAG: hypothetical protein EBR30_20585 [Cytophagia bacterium]|nr:hypothetical protein [Cytophagia bacterium]NBW37368.1 hypothetical protein [Cytophagia bacterium]
MILKRLKLFGFMAIITTLVLTACKDEFNEEDFLRLQDELAQSKEQRDSAYLASLSKEQAEAYIASLNEAGDFMSVSILVRADNVPVSGVAVTIGAGNIVAGGRVESVKTVTATTDASGVATFERVYIGTVTINLTKTGFVSASAILNFGTPPTPTAVQTSVNGITKTIYTLPRKRFESIVLPVFSKDATAGGSTATITGTVSIETDLTNKAEEFPAGTVVRASFTDLLTGLSPTVPNTVTAIGYAFDDGNFGTATIAANGSYTLVVPASAAGRNVGLIFPEITANQRLAISTRNNDDVTPEYALVPTVFGPAVGGYDAIPFVSGAKAVFDAPPAAASGLKLGFTPKPRGFTSADYGFPWTETNPTQEFRAGATVFQLTNVGRYTASPVITITGGGGSGASMLAALEGYLSGATVTNVGSGYGASTNVSINLYWTDKDNNDFFLNSFNVTTTATGTLPATITIPSNGFAFSESDPFNTSNQGLDGFEVASFKMTVGGAGTGAVVTPVITAGVGALRVQQIGSGYTSAPTVTFAAGISGNTATLAIREFYTQFFVTMDNSANVGNYSIIPDDIQYRLINTGGGQINPTSSYVIDQQGNGNNLENLVTVVNGDVVFQDAAKTYYTNYYGKLPVSLVANIETQIAEATVYIYEGKFDGLDIDNNGRGYTGIFNVSIEPTITGAPGTGAKLTLTDGGFDSQTREYFWNGNYFTENRGSGYLENLNQQSSIVNYSGTSTVNVKSGEVKTINVKYGTGKRQQVVGGNVIPL